MALWIWPALFAWLVLAAMLPSAAVRFVAVWFGVLLVLLTAGLHLVRRSILVTTHVPARLVHGEHSDLVVTITNRGRLPAPRIRVHARVPSGGFDPADAVVEVALRGHSTREVRVPITAHSRGRWRPEAAQVVVSDPFGLHELALSGIPPAESVVLPALAPVRRLDLPAVAPLAELPDPRSLLHDPTAIIGVRPYQPGDPLRAIHWPASAATGALVRRETERAWARDLVVVLDLNDGGWRHSERRAAEAAITVAASLLVDAILVQRQPAGLVATLPAPAGESTRREPRPPTGRPMAASFRVGSSRRHLDAMLVHLATARLQAGAPVATLLRRHAHLQQPGTTVAVIANDVDDDLVDALRDLRSTGASPYVLHVANPHVFDQQPRGLHTGGTPVVRVAADVGLTRLRL